MKWLRGSLAGLLCTFSVLGASGGCGSPEQQEKLHTNLQKLERDSNELEEATQKEENARGCTPTYCPPE